MIHYFVLESYIKIPHCEVICSKCSVCAGDILHNWISSNKQKMSKAHIWGTFDSANIFRCPWHPFDWLLEKQVKSGQISRLAVYHHKVRLHHSLDCYSQRWQQRVTPKGLGVQLPENVTGPAVTESHKERWGGGGWMRAITNREKTRMLLIFLYIPNIIFLFYLKQN